MVGKLARSVVPLSPPSKADDLRDAVLSPETGYEDGIVRQCLLSSQVPHVLSSGMARSQDILFCCGMSFLWQQCMP